MQRGVYLWDTCTLSLFNYVMDSANHFFIIPNLSDYAARNTQLRCTFYLNSLLDEIGYCSSCADMVVVDGVTMTETYIVSMHLVLPTIYNSPTRYWCNICTRPIWVCLWNTGREGNITFPRSVTTSAIVDMAMIRVQSSVEE